MVDNMHMGGILHILAVYRPWNVGGFTELNGDLGSTQADHLLALTDLVDIAQKMQCVAQLQCAVRLLDERDLEHPVIKVEIIDVQHPAHGGGIGDHTINIVVLELLPVTTDIHPERAQIPDLGGCVDDIGKRSDHILDVLRRLIGHIRERTECGDIVEAALVDRSGIDSAGNAV